MLSRYLHVTVDVVHDNAYWRVLRDNGHLALIRVNAQAHTESRTALEVTLAAATGEVDFAALVAQVAQVLSVDVDLAPFYAYARTDSTLWQILQPVVGLHWVRVPTVFEALMTTIIEQQIAWTAAQKAQRWLVEWGGQHIPHNGRTYYAFPTPAQIAAATPEIFTPMKITFRRMGVMIAIAQQVAEGTLDLEAIRQMPADAAYQALVSLKGVGHWTAAWTLQRAWGYHNYVGHQDVALQAAVNHYFYGGVGRIPAEKVMETFAQYGEYAGIAANHTIVRWVLDRYKASHEADGL